MDIERIENPVNKFEEFKYTTNDSVYRKHYKERNAGCSYCKWHRNENYRGKWYGGCKSMRGRSVKHTEITYPSWKLASKQKKQWMYKGKDYKVIEEETRNGVYYSVEFKRNKKR